MSEQAQGEYGYGKTIEPHLINGIIKENKTLSINIVDEGILPQADYSGSVSGAKRDKSSLFGYEAGEAGTPVIKRPPFVMECTVADEYDSPGFENFICKISNTYFLIVFVLFSLAACRREEPSGRMEPE